MGREPCDRHGVSGPTSRYRSTYTPPPHHPYGPALPRRLSDHLLHLPHTTAVFRGLTVSSPSLPPSLRLLRVCVQWNVFRRICFQPGHRSVEREQCPACEVSFRCLVNRVSRLSHHTSQPHPTHQPTLFYDGRGPCYFPHRATSPHVPPPES